MPEMDGYEAARRIRAFEAERRKTLAKNSPEFAKQTPRQLLAHPAGVPIIAMTANVFREDIEKCLEAGMNDHVGKPLELNKVLEKLHAYLPNS
jgi:CheY-like chemotaxis protein